MSIYINKPTEEKVRSLYGLYETMISCDQRFLVLEGGIAVGKTFLAQKLAEKIVKATNDDERKKYIHLYQFHEGYSYENFVYGLQIKTEKNQLNYSKGNQPITEIINMCNRDMMNHVLIIDDMNRTNIMATFGDLFSALESAEVGNAIKTDDGDLRIPNNLFIIGTINPMVGKHSIDYAWFRRFTVCELRADSKFFDVEENCIKEYRIFMDYAKEIFEHVRMLFDYYFTDQDNQREKEKYIPGHGLFLQYDTELLWKDNLRNLHNRLKYIVAPILEEYIRQGVLEEYASLDVKAISNIWGNDLDIECVKPNGKQFGRLHGKINELIEDDSLPRNALFFFVLHSANCFMKIWNFNRDSAACLFERSEKKSEALDEDIKNANKQGHRGASGKTKQRVDGFDYSWISGTAHGSLGMINIKGKKIKAINTKDMIDELINNIEYVIERIRLFMEMI